MESTDRRRSRNRWSRRQYSSDVDDDDDDHRLVLQYEQDLASGREPNLDELRLRLLLDPTDGLQVVGGASRRCTFRSVQDVDVDPSVESTRVSRATASDTTGRGLFTIVADADPLDQNFRPACSSFRS